ncbi:oligosaccharide flippase family protein [Bifidobacterium moukalabense]|uniref:oligosaccharide flippase family protein n=1 Tax=Bifidobacterium moukalabense TaxID=1333651 RepID=UPI0022847EF3|nr:oligosaccharide flippase family protein [Bifidobacterium moukalabense]
MSVSVFFNTVNMVPNGLLLKGKKFKLIGVRLFITTIVGGLAAIVLAYVGFGVFALVANINITAILVFLWNYLSIKKELSFTDLHIISSIRIIAKYSLFSSWCKFCKLLR